MREYVVIYGNARVTEGAAVPLLQRRAPIYLGPKADYPPASMRNIAVMWQGSRRQAPLELVHGFNKPLAGPEGRCSHESNSVQDFWPVKRGLIGTLHKVSGRSEAAGFLSLARSCAARCSGAPCATAAAARPGASVVRAEDQLSGGRARQFSLGHEQVAEVRRWLGNYHS
jgi:hypothetical protein